MPVNTSPPPIVDQLHHQDVRTIVRLLSQIATMAGNISDKKQALMKGLCNIVDADYWIWNVMSFEVNQTPHAYSCIHNMPEDIFTAFVAGNYELPNSEINQQIAAHTATGKHWTRKRTHLVPPEIFKTTELCTKYLSQTNIGDSIISIYPIQSDPMLVSGGSIHRTTSKPCFTDRECLIYHIITSEIDWLHNLDLLNTEDPQHAQLPPRLQTVFALLMDGLTPKRIAHNLNLTENTVRTYIRQIYKHYDVSGRIELTKRFTHGDGNHLPL
ncbi:Bacterial regulatory protein, luxR family [Poriferisphaera corsica]|uniref:Bacterial regulatory protein, luxR family n=1 Tax=Poriferisphaera corsica TaxID=2528020 RepID=A0A517YR69_9BACT|nr:LuxR C-terminal-related transcriptional regulator [Poriferisphaera corsica]QDU32704.1 Bacterial regulatory protein, luxR family [Poriferisphaera corsica]